MAASATSQALSPREPVVPAWHTVVVLLILLGFSYLGSRQGNIPGIKAHGRSGGYLLAIVMEWSITAFIWYEVRRRGGRMRDLVGGRWARFMDFLRDLGIAIGFLVICAVGVTNGVTHLLKASTPSSVRNLLPQGPKEIALYLLLALTAGFCEEVIFRGYLQRQFAALTHAITGGIVLQGIAFGAVHGYQGWKLMTAITVFGITFGLLATWRHSLRPGMIAHFVQDGVGGLLGRHLMR